MNIRDLIIIRDGTLGTLSWVDKGGAILNDDSPFYKMAMSVKAAAILNLIQHGDVRRPRKAAAILNHYEIMFIYSWPIIHIQMKWLPIMCHDSLAQHCVI